MEMNRISYSRFFSFITQRIRWLYILLASLSWVSLTRRLYPQDFFLGWRVGEPVLLPEYSTYSFVYVGGRR